MPGGAVAAKRYAEAVFSLAQEQDRLDEWYEQLATVADTLVSTELIPHLQTPGLAPEQRLTLLDRVIPPVDPLLHNLVALLLSKSALPLISGIAGEYRRLIDRHRGVQRARVKTAVALEPAEEARIASRLREITGGEVVVDLEVDESILGGFVARVGDKLIDGSTKSRLLQLKGALREGAPRDGRLAP